MDMTELIDQVNNLYQICLVLLKFNDKRSLDLLDVCQKDQPEP